MPDSHPIQLYCDGACRGNPGPAAIGGVIYRGDEVLAEISERMGVGTNNEAEYTSLIRGLERALELGQGSDPAVGVPTNTISSIDIYMDSELVVRQVEGRYKVKNERLRPLHARVHELLGQFPAWRIHHVPRARNAVADRLANAAYEP